MSRADLLNEQRDWQALANCPGWARLKAKQAEKLRLQRMALETMTPDNIALPRFQGKIEEVKDIAGDQYTEYGDIAERMVAEIADKLKGEPDGR